MDYKRDNEFLESNASYFCVVTEFVMLDDEERILSFNDSGIQARKREAGGEKYFINEGNRGREQYSCSLCGRLYKEKTTLVRHMKFECGREAQFQCPVCPKKTKQKYNLVLHMRRRHKLQL